MRSRLGVRWARISLNEGKEALLSNIPISLLASYCDQDVVVRGSDPASLVEAALEICGNRIKRVQLLSPDLEIDALCALPPSVPIDLCLTTLRQSEGISRWSGLFRDRSVRLVVPVIKGFSHVVKEALKADLRVMLEIDQPNETLVDELKDTFVFFVREPDVKQPVDPFSQLLKSFLTKRVESLWRIQEEHPRSYRYIKDTGEVSLSKRLSHAVQDSNVSRFLAEHKLNLFLRKDECCTCRFFIHCEGYFKLPVQGYRCSGVKEVLSLVWDCAAELRTDLSQGPSPGPADS